MNEAPARQPRPATASIFRVFNQFPKVVLRSPFHALMDRRFILLEVVGRKTQRAYHIPVAFVEHDSALLVGAGAPWVKNLQNGTQIAVWYHGKKRNALVEIVRDPTEFAQLVGVILKINPIWGRFNQLALGADGHVSSEQLDRAIRRGATLFRLRLT